ncbi:metal ABC transporter permease [Geobacter hydrogenophilus]|uniref:ABC transporter n=1 Tax=Geobacter hydrogenophilus TaxID=40983 RepID=A0A9W6G123_9BACT|nr:metal ABC transporter permease [Geobacter hydrogenophilus]MBT0894186.1 metal ABC transporter permease [Geobacter hydrogenophilus]GLI38531.1 ABC transporter [Geobacter hydrogenophilus]
MTFLDIFHYDFLLRALGAGSLIAALCAVLGVFLVLRRLSLIGDGLAHVTFGSVALALFLRFPSVYAAVAAIPAVLMAALGILRLAERARIYGDAAIGIVSSLGVATGIMLASMAGGFNVDLFSYLFGNILSISPFELGQTAVLFVIVCLTVVFFYHDLFAIAFDEELARTSGIRVDRINAVLVLLTALTVVLAMKVVGIMLISALLILPAVTSLQIARGFRTAILLAVVLGVLSVVSGIVISFLANLPAGATIILVNFTLFLISFGVRKLRK